MLALLFDIHGTLPALDAVLGDSRARGADRWLLGVDYAAFGGWPAETTARMRSCTIRLGYVGTSTAGPATQAPDFELAQTGVVACPEALDVETRSALGALPESADLRRGTRAWHASPKRDMRSSSPQPGQNKNELLDGVSDRRRVFGHYHLTFERTSALGIELVGPGSVGIPMDGDHRAAYALLHDDAASAARVRETAAGASWGETIAPRIEQATA
jgi:hypothetical protein